MTVTSGVTTEADLMVMSGRLLASWTASVPMGTAGPDLGPAVLAVLVDDEEARQDAVRAWLRSGTRCHGGLGLFGGMSGILAGLRLIAAVSPCAVPAAERAAAALGEVATWHTNGVGFTDYDLVSGPAGMVLAQLTGSIPTRPEHVSAAVDHLAALGSDASLVGLRIGAHRDHPLLGWSQGGIVTGLAHGAAGVLAALSVAPDMPAAARAIQNISSWLVHELTTDCLGIATWPRRGGDRPIWPEPRQAWCYGNPGVSWALWTASQALTRAGVSEGRELGELAAGAMRTLCDRFDPGLHLGTQRFSVCHGAAGLMLLADAFARHAALTEAALLRDRLAAFLHDNLGEVTRLGENDMSLLTGASGVLAALLTVGGADRDWLRCLGLH
jgi:hypothetical protein